MWETLDKQEPGILFIRDDQSNTYEDVVFSDVIAVLTAPTSDGGVSSQQYSLLHISGKGENVQLADIKHFIDLPASFLQNYLIHGTPKHLSVTRGPHDTCHLHIVVSVKSGTCEALTFCAVVQKVLQAFGITEQEYEVHQTVSDRSIKEFAANVLLPRANAGIVQTVVLLSGDGGITDIVDTLLQSSQGLNFVKPIIGLLVSGTGNALANSSGLNCDSTRGLSSFLRGSPHDIPAFVCRFSPGSELLVDEGRKTEALLLDSSRNGVVYGAVVCSWALHASLVADSDTTEFRKYGVERFQMAARELLQPSDGSDPHLYQGRITIYKKVDENCETAVELKERKQMYVLATLVSNLESRLQISPSSKPLDGQLRLIRFGMLSSDEIMKIFGLAYAGGEHVKESTVDYEAIEGMRIDLQESDRHWRRVCVDGKIIRVGAGGWMEIRRELRTVLSLVSDTLR